jgi:hypothetical protein
MSQRVVTKGGEAAPGRAAGSARAQIGRAVAASARALWRGPGPAAGTRETLAALEPRLLMAATDVVINEIMYNSATAETADEYVELYNRGTTPVSLNGWKLSKGVDYTFGNVTLNAGAYLVVAANTARFAQKYPTVTNAVGPWVGQLSNSSDDVRLLTSTGLEIDRVEYADDGEWAARRRGGQDARAVASITNAGGTATVTTAAAHGYANGNRVALFGANQAGYSGIFTIAGVTANSFTIEVPAGTATPATGQIYVRRQDFLHFGWDWFSPADGMGKSLELINPVLSNNRGQNWAPSAPDHGTPGAANSVASNNVAPLIADLRHSPALPRSTDVVTVSAKVDDELLGGLTVQAFFREDGAASFDVLPMFDDGLHDDGSANDGVYAAQLPPRAGGTVVEFYVKATDASGRSRTWPGPTDVTGAQQANALYQVDDATFVAGQPQFRLIMTEAERLELDDIGNGGGDSASNAQMNGTFVSVDGAGTDVRYLAGFRNRGGGSRTAVVNNYRVEFGDFNGWHGRTAINLNAIYSASEIAASALAARAGVAAQYATAVQVRVNAQNLATAGNGMYGSYSYVEGEDGDLVDRLFPTDDQGNYYRGVDGINPLPQRRANLTPLANPADYRLYYPKQTNAELDDYTDLTALITALSNTNAATFAAGVLQHADVEQWMRYFAFNVLSGNNETSIGTGIGDDFALYRGAATGAKFRLVAHDMDTVLTLGDSVAPVGQSIFRAASTQSASVTRLLRAPEFAPIFFRQLKDLADTVFTPGELARVMRHAIGGYVDASVIDAAVANGVARAAAALAQIPDELAVTAAPASSAGYPRVTNAAQLAAMTLGGGADARVTRSVRVNGRTANYSVYQGTWSITNGGNTLGLNNGLNRVVVQALDAGGLEVGRTFVDVWYQNGVGTNVSGTIGGSVTWSPQNGPYRVTGNVTVNTGATLTIQPGTTVYFADNTRLTVNGTLVAVGSDPTGATNSGHVRFTHDPVGHSTATASWAGVYFANSMQANRLTYADIEFAGLNGQPTTQLLGSSVDFDRVTWATPGSNSVILDIGNGTTNPNSFSLTNSVLPNAINAEVFHFFGQIPAGGKAIVRGNVFGTTTGHNDIIDFTGGNRPGPILQVLDNVFLGTGTGGAVADDILDIDGTDAHIEGNVFMHVQPSPTSDSNSAISGGRDSTNAATGTNRSEIVSERNFYYDVDHAFLMKEGNSVRSVNDTFVKVHTGVFNFDEPGFAASKGQGGYVDGGVFFDVATDGNGSPVIVQNAPAGVFDVRRSIVPSANPLTGTANLNLDPRLLNTAAVLDPRVDFLLKPFSPAIGTGPNGKDMGAAVPAGASVRGEPGGVSPFNTATMTVGGPAILAYQWRLDNGAWSAPVNVTNPLSNNPTIPNIALSNLANGTHRVSVVVQNSAGIWQATNQATLSGVWTVNATILGRVRINEVLADNDGALTNGTTTPDAIELYNDGKGTIDLSDYSITDDPLVPRKFVFPAGTQLAQGQYLVVYADDASPGAGGLHLGFSLGRNGDGVYVYNKASAGGALVDSVTFGTQLADLSVGRVGDGTTWGLTRPTFGAANVAAPTGDPATLRINEWQATGAPPFSDDFVELYNPDALPVALAGLYLTDGLAAWPTRHAFAPLSFAPAGGFLKLTADGDTGAGADHLPFKLEHDRGEVALVANDLSVIDFVFYDSQSDGVSEGLLPDGTGDYTFFPDPTPGLANVIGNPGTSPSPIRVTEVMYNAPGDAANAGDEYEFIELQNTGPNPVNLNGYGFNAGIDFTFGNLTLAAGQRVVAVKNLAAFTARYGTGINVAGEYGDSLDNGGETVRLLDNNGGVVQEFAFAPTWYDSTDGGGNALVVNDARQPRALWGDPTGWHASTSAVLGTPGVGETTLPVEAVVVNEVLANSGPAGTAGDWIELRNTTGAPLDVSGWYLSDSAADLTKFRIPANTIIPANGFVTFAEAQGFGATSAAAGERFALSSAGGGLYLSSATAANVLGGFREFTRFGASERGVTMGRHTVSTGKTKFVAQSRPTRNTANALPRVGPVVINEVMYHPESTRDEYVELKNVTAAAVNVGGWQFTSGVTFTFPVGTSIGPGQTLIVTPGSISAADFRAKYAIPASVAIVSGYGGGLSNGGEELELSKPGEAAPENPATWVVVDEVEYETATPWPAAPDGTGPSLSRFVETAFGNDPANWRASTAIGGTPGAANDASPLTAAGEFVQLSAHRLVVRFSKNVASSLATADLQLINLTTGQTVPTASMALSYDAASNVATFTFPGVAGGRLATGRYRATLLAAGINGGGSSLDGNGDGTGGDNHVFEFVHLPGDVNADAKVDFADYQLFERNFGKTAATWADGDYDYNGTVGAPDLKILLANMNVSLPAGAPAEPVTTPAPPPAPVVSNPPVTQTPTTPATPTAPVSKPKPAPAKPPVKRPTPARAAVATVSASPFSATAIVKKKDAAAVWA